MKAMMIVVKMRIKVTMIVVMMRMKVMMIVVMIVMTVTLKNQMSGGLELGESTCGLH